jgi:hypothetical protein
MSAVDSASWHFVVRGLAVFLALQHHLLWEFGKVVRQQHLVRLRVAHIPSKAVAAQHCAFQSGETHVREPPSAGLLL